MVSSISAGHQHMINCFVFTFCFQFHFAPLQLGGCTSPRRSGRAPELLEMRQPRTLSTTTPPSWSTS